MLWKFILSRVILPGSPASDANRLDDIDANLTDVNEEENKEPERAVDPVERWKWRIWRAQWAQEGHRDCCICGHNFGSCCLPECSIKRSVPTDKRTRREKQKPEDRQAKVHTSVSIHSKPGEAGDQVCKQSPSVHWKVKRERKNTVNMWRGTSA